VENVNLNLKWQNLKKIPKIKIKVGALVIIIIILISFFVRIPNPNSNIDIMEFSLDVENNKSRTGYPITFIWEIMGNPSQVAINWGDGNVKLLTDQLIEENNTFSGSMSHSYLLQGKYSPKLQIWDNFGKEYSKTCDLTIQNDILHFNVNITPASQIFEDEEVFISVENIFEINKGIKKDFENLTYFYDFGDSQLTSYKSNVSNKWKNEGNYSLTISIIDSQGTISRKSTSIEVKNRPPEAYFPITMQMDRRAHSKIQFSAEYCVDTESDKNSLRYLWNWGDHSASWGKFSSHTYPLHGFYNITLYVIDDNGAMDSYFTMIAITKAPDTEDDNTQSNTDANNPYIAIGTLPTEVFEDEQVQLISEIELQEGNIADYTTFWMFGDGTNSYERAPLHSWTQAGTYDINLKVLEVNGNDYFRYEKIIIKEKPPEILGPFSFQGIEGRTIILDVEVYDSKFDDPYLKYFWYDDRDQLFSTNKKPSVNLDDGDHHFTLRVIDPSGLISTKMITVIVHPISPEIFIPNYVYFGKNPGVLE